MWSRIVARTARRSSSALSTGCIASKQRASHVLPLGSLSIRFGSSESTTPSRFLSLVDEEKTKQDAEGEERDESAGDEDGKEDTEGNDGDIEVDVIPDVNKGGVMENDELDEHVMELFMENPLRWTPTVLARKFHLSKPRVEAIIWLKRMEADLTPEEFRDKVQEAKERARKENEAHAKKLAEAEASGNEKEAARLKKRERQEEEATEPDEELDAREEATLMGVDDEPFRNPEFFFLNDEFEGYPPLVRRMGKHGHTDQLYPEEALELQRLAGNNKIELMKSFADPKNNQSKARFCLAVKDISTKKKHLLVRDRSRTLRLATNEEVLPRTWVRRPPHFRGLDKELA
ncbi:unnamed protein product [Peronospora belbahrii]|uniref:Ribosomal protein S24/S35 mitochondrial conserved domain-containing protein n=1 Tax=Peronospora belbahrii TaxID=622444 RepID=A0AAU9LJ43_9STRA|nr:unnamed protein product [Peronospora belbahrii]CAH0522341.1 unnamed protein product [Peronospora belbahrii]